jgi:hypothetical protein
MHVVICRKLVKALFRLYKVRDQDSGSRKQVEIGASLIGDVGPSWKEPNFKKRIIVTSLCLSILEFLL